MRKSTRSIFLNPGFPLKLPEANHNLVLFTRDRESQAETLSLQIKYTKHFLSLIYLNHLFLIIAFTPPVIIESPERLAIIKNAGS